MAYRAWSCPCCRAAYRRSLSEVRIAPDCEPCGRPMVATVARHEYRACRHRRKAEALRRKAAKVESRPRTSSGRVLRPSTATKAAWRSVRAARTRPAMIRRSQAFLEALALDARDHFGPDGVTVVRWRTLPSGKGKSASHGGLVPQVVLGTARAMGADTLGLYESKIGRRTITVQGGRPLEEMRQTVVHEALHWLDHEAHVSDRWHGSHWATRLAEMLRHFPAGEPRRPGVWSRS